MQKIGMKPEDNLPKQILESGMYEDLVHYGMVKSMMITLTENIRSMKQRQSGTLFSRPLLSLF
ncbi:hypothetical protein D3C73_1125220 [compost metagenome]